MCHLFLTKGNYSHIGLQLYSILSRLFHLNHIGHLSAMLVYNQPFSFILNVAKCLANLAYTDTCTCRIANCQNKEYANFYVTQQLASLSILANK